MYYLPIPSGVEFYYFLGNVKASSGHILRPMTGKKSAGIPATKPARLKNGFYVGVKNKGMSTPVMMYSPTREGMMLIAQRYGVFPEKEVVVMGEHKNDKWVDQEQPKRGRKKKEVAEN